MAANRPEAPHSALRARLAEVDGLRALAVLAVLLFHVGFAPFGGGFVGVDVFFVISGFVITRNILIGIETRSFREFYLRRFRGSHRQADICRGERQGAVRARHGPDLRVVAEMKAVNPRLKVFIIGGYFHLAAHKATWLSGKYRERLDRFT